MFKRRKEEARKGAPMWMTTFSDLMTLILVFFILLFAFSEVDATKFRMIANSFKGIFEDQSTFFYDFPPNNPLNKVMPTSNLKNKSLNDAENKQTKENEQLDDLLAKIKSYLHDHNLEGEIFATREKRGVVLVLQENILFDSGRAVVKQQAKPFLNKVSNLINSLSNDVEVEGHTDSQRIIQPSQYVSNWNLAGDRAANVVNYFINEQNTSSTRFKISGYADTKPIASNNSVEGRQKNRRVVIVILDNNGNSSS